MRTVFNPNLKAYLSLDDADRVRSINHFQKYWASDEKTPLLAAIDYLHRMASVLSVPEVQLKNLHQRVSFLTPLEQGIEYRLSEEKQQFDSTTLSFYQTYLNVPVWQAGFTVTVKHGPYRIISAVNTSQEEGFDAKLPAPKLIERYKKLFTQAELENQSRRLEAMEEKEESKTADFVRELMDMGELKKSSQAARTDHARLIRGRFYVYKFDTHKRLPAQPSQTVAFSPTEKEPILPLPPMPETIKHGRYYMVAEVTFSFTTKEYGRLNWLALVEIETGAVLYLRALVGTVNGRVFVHDPITTTGDATHTPDQTNAVLNPHRTLEPLLHLDAPVAGVQSLRGTYANVTNVENPNIAPPTEPAGTDFEDDVRTNDFAAVNAYYHVDRFFNLVESLGFPIGTYFNNTTFPIPVDHRGLGTAINAHCVGNGTGGIGHLCYALADSNTTDPLGIACDWGVHLHELGAHGILYEHVGTANLGFTHGPGDVIAAIAIDPESQAPDRFSFTHWLDMRRFDRDVATGWAWGGVMDDKAYKSGEILATTLFRVYRSIGGDSTDLARRQFSSRMMLYLILRAVQNLTPATNPSNVLGFANELMAVDLLNWASEGVYGGAYNKVIRWSFERQGLYQAPGAPTPVTTAGQPPECDVYIEDGRGGEYPYQAIHWGNTSIWNRRNPDGITTHEEPALAATNYAYVKIKNRGTQTANNVKVRGYHCKPTAGVVWPNDFQAFTTAELPAPGGGTLLGNNAEEKIVGPFEWTPVVNAWGHDCMLMIVSANGDPSNVDNFTLGEFVQDWRLVPNDNNVGQRNVTLAPGGGGLEALMQALHGYSFWVGNPNLKTATMKLRVQLPQVLAANGWRLSFKGLPNNQFELRSGKQREIVMELRPGKDFDKNQVERTTDRDIRISVYADDALIGGMTYRLDPALTAAYNVARKAECLGKAQELLECLNISGQKVKKVHVQKVTLDIKTRDDDCDP